MLWSAEGVVVFGLAEHGLRDYDAHATETYSANTNATVLMSYGDNKVTITEGSWDLPRSFYNVEVFGNNGSVAMKYVKTFELVIGTEKKPLESGALAGARAEPIRAFVDDTRNNKAVEGVVAGDFNVNIMQIVEAAKRSATSGKAVNLPLK